MQQAKGRTDTGGGAVGAAEDDRDVDVAGRHVVLLGGRVDDVVNGLHREVERHELDDRLGVVVGGADGETGEASFRDRRVDDALVAVLLPEALGDLVGAVVARDLLAEQEDLLVALELLVHGGVERVAHRHLVGDGGHAAAQQRAGVGDGARVAEDSAEHAVRIGGEGLMGFFRFL